MSSRVFTFALSMPFFWPPNTSHISRIEKTDARFLLFGPIRVREAVAPEVIIL